MAAAGPACHSSCLKSHSYIPEAPKNSQKLQDAIRCFLELAKSWSPRHTFGQLRWHSFVYFSGASGAPAFGQLCWPLYCLSASCVWLVRRLVVSWATKISGNVCNHFALKIRPALNFLSPHLHPNHGHAVVGRARKRPATSATRAGPNPHGGASRTARTATSSKPCNVGSAVVAMAHRICPKKIKGKHTQREKPR